MMSPGSRCVEQLVDRGVDERGRHHDPHRARLRELRARSRRATTRRSRPSAASSVDRVGAHVVDDALVAVAHEPPHEVRAHPAEADHAELHRVSLRHRKAHSLPGERGVLSPSGRDGRFDTERVRRMGSDNVERRQRGVFGVRDRATSRAARLALRRCRVVVADAHCLRAATTAARTVCWSSSRASARTGTRSASTSRPSPMPVTTSCSRSSQASGDARRWRRPAAYGAAHAFTAARRQDQPPPRVRQSNARPATPSPQPSRAFDRPRNTRKLAVLPVGR